MYGFSVLDIGAYAGYFSLRLAEEFGASCTAVDSEPLLKKSLARPGSAQVQGVYHRLSGPDEMLGMGRFDVGLCLSVLHHVPWWRDMLEALLTQCDLVFLEVPSAGEWVDGHPVADPLIEEAVSALEGEVLCRTEGNPSPSNPLRELIVVTGKDAT